MALPAPKPTDTILITGASSGIGEALAREFASRGHGVTLVARSVDKLDALATELAATGVRAEALAADLSVRADRDALAGRVADLGLDVSVLVNNAGLSTVGPVAESTVDAELNMVEVDVVAVAHLTTAFLPQLVARGSGAVLNVASTAAFQPIPGQAGYAACKAFVLSFTQAIAAELAGTGVTASALCPGPVETNFIHATGMTQEEAAGTLPSFMWESAESVAKCGVNAVANGTVVAIPGIANRVVANASHALPKRLLLPILAKQHPALKR